MIYTREQIIDLKRTVEITPPSAAMAAIHSLCDTALQVMAGGREAGLLRQSLQDQRDSWERHARAEQAMGELADKKIAKARALHHQDGAAGDGPGLCVQCRVAIPCPTLEALNGAKRPHEDCQRCGGEQRIAVWTDPITFTFQPCPEER